MRDGGREKEREAQGVKNMDGRFHKGIVNATCSHLKNPAKHKYKFAFATILTLAEKQGTRLEQQLEVITAV